MPSFNYRIYHVGRCSLDDEDETQFTTPVLSMQCVEETSDGYEAIKKCLDSEARADFLEIRSLLSDRILSNAFKPLHHWGSLEKFDDRVQLHILSMKIQLNLEVSLAEATDAVVISTLGI